MYVPWVLGVPAIVAVPSPLSVKLNPAGSRLDFFSVGKGYPSVVTVNENGTPVTAVADFAEVIVGRSRLQSPVGALVAPQLSVQMFAVPAVSDPMVAS